METRLLKLTLISLLLILTNSDVFAQLPLGFNCGIDSSSLAKSITSQGLSTNGYSLTPKGNLRALVVFVGVKGNTLRNQQIPGWDTATNGLPSTVNPQNGDMPNLFYTRYSQFDSISSNNKSVSRWYYDMSQGQFKFIAEVLKDPITNLPVRIDVDGSPNFSRRLSNGRYDTTITYYPSTIISQVLATIRSKYDTLYNWSRFDNRTNAPSYLYRSDTTQPDNKIDFIILVFRYNGQFTVGSKTMLIQTTGNAYAGINGLSNTFISSSHTPYICDLGFTYVTGGNVSNSLSETSWVPDVGRAALIHELDHMIVRAPHVCLNNGVHVNKFNMNNGISSMNLYDGSIGSCNAYESWYHGWSNLYPWQQINQYQASRIYRLTGFFKNRDSSYLRIKIPSGRNNHYLWIENHSDSHVWNSRPIYNEDALGNIVPQVQNGLYAWIQDQSDRDSTTKVSGDALSSAAANGYKFLDASGNYDYSSIDSGRIAPELFNLRVFSFNKGRKNPLGMYSSISRFREDVDTKYGLTGFGSSSPQYIAQNNNANGGAGTEQIPFWKTPGESVFNFTGTKMAFGINSNREKVGISEDVTIKNYTSWLNYDYGNYDHASPEKLEPTILNGISFRIIDKQADGTMNVEVKTNDTDIDKNQRFTGEIQLPNIDGASNDLNIKTGVTLTLDKSGNPNRRYKRVTGSYNRGYFPDFIFPSSLTCKTGSVLNMERQSIFYVSDSSALVLESGSTLNVGSNAFLGILNGSILKIKSGATLSIADSGIVEIKPGSQICIEAGAIINLHNKGIIALRPGFYSGISSVNAFMIESTSCKPLLALVLGDISISCICKPSSLQSGASNPRLSAKVAGMHPRYLWKVISGTAILSDSTASSPFVNSVTSDSVTFRLTVIDSLNNYSIRDFKVKFTTEQRPIYLMRDGWDDNGVEAYPGYVYNSEDLAVTTDSALVSSDSLPLHQNAQRKGSVRNASTANWLYARVRNVGCKSGPSSSTGNQLHFYWTKASLGEMWSRDWLLNNDIIAPFQISGEEITNVYDTASSSYINSVISVSNIAPGSAKVYGHRWFPPRPQNYAGGAAITEICVLARITDGSSGNGSMLPAANQSGAYEQDNVEVSQNVRNFRAIATKNLFVYNDNPVNEFIHNSNGGVEVSQSYIRWGGTGTAENQVLTIEAPTPTNGSSFNPMDWRKIYRLKIILGQTLYNKMSASLSGNTDVQLLPSDYGFEVIGSGFHSASVYLSKTELYPLKVVFVRKVNSDVVSPIDFMFRISAYASSDNKLLGSQQYNIKASPFVSGKPNEDALRFDGTNDFVLTATLPEYSFDGTDFSLGAMVKITEKNQNWNHRILTVGKQGFNGFAWGIDENEDHSFTPYLTIGTAKVKADVTANADGYCHYTAVVKRSDRIEFYWDGKLLSVISGSINGISIPTNEPTTIGGVLPETEENAFFYGNLDNVCIWQRSLSPNEIKNYQFNGVSVDEIANLISYWDFDEETQVFTDQNVLDHYATLGTSVATETYDPTYLESCSDEALKDSYNQGASSGLEGGSQTGTVTRGLLVSPNPSESVYTVTLTDLAASGSGGNGTVNFSVVSMSGNTLLQVTNQNLSTYTFQFQLNAAVGIYRLNVLSGTNVYNALLIKR